MAKERNHDVISGLSKLLAEGYILLLKTQNYHWNVTGMNFGPLHALFEEQYTEQFAANDEIAERLRALGEKAPGSFAAFAKISDVAEETGDPDAKTMIKNLLADHETMAETAKALNKAACDTGDDATADMAIERIQAHDKAAWMLRSHLD